jgi:hypothetical protein
VCTRVGTACSGGTAHYQPAYLGQLRLEGVLVAAARLERPCAVHAYQYLFVKGSPPMACF